MSQDKVIAYLEKKEAESRQEAILWFMKDGTGPLRNIYIKAKTPYGVILKLHSFYQETKLDPEKHNSMELITTQHFYPSHQDDAYLADMIEKDVDYFVENELGKVTDIKIYE